MQHHKEQLLQQKNYCNVGGESAVAMRKSYYNISSTTNATSEKIPVTTKKIYCNIGEESAATTSKSKMKHLKNCSATSEKCLLQQPKKVPLQHSTSSIATLKMNHCKNNDEI